MQLKQFYNIATKVSGRKKCYYFWWSTWLFNDEVINAAIVHKEETITADPTGNDGS